MTDTTNSGVVENVQTAQTSTGNEQPKTPVQPVEPVVPEINNLNDNNVEPKDEENIQDTPQPFEKTGETGLDVALDFAFKHGYSSTHPSILAASNGDWSLIEAELATKNIPGYKEMVELAKKGFANLVEKQEKVQKEIEAAVMSVVGNDNAMYQSILDFASKNADPAEREQLNAMFDAGPLQAKAAMMILREAYETAVGTTVKPQSAVKGQIPSSVNTQSGGLSRSEYVTAVKELANRIGSHNLNNSPEYKELNRRRSIQMKLEPR